MNKGFLVLLVISALFITTAELRSENSDADQKNYIMTLYSNGKYFQAIAETDRLVTAYSLDAHDYSYFIALNYFAGGQYRSAAENITFRSGMEFSESQVLYLYSLYNLGDTEAVKSVMSSINITEVNQKYISDLCYIHTSVFLDSYDFKKAYETFSMYSNTAHADGFGPESEKILSEYRELEFKSENLSMFLSAMLPGAGQIYSGKLSAGLFSIISIAGSAFVTYELFSNRYRNEAVLTGAFTALLYAGNIYGARNSARYYNLDKCSYFRKKVLEELEYNYDPDKYLDRETLHAK